MDYKIETIRINDENFPKKLKAIKKPPEKLYAIGNLDLLNANCITVVGSRKCSEYGVKMTEKFSRELSAKGITVVSGLALRDRYNCSY